MTESHPDPWAMVFDYLNAGGFFNPEHMDHEKVRDMILALRDARAADAQTIAKLRARVARLEAELDSERSVDD